jgi:hypothetical protein
MEGPTSDTLALSMLLASLSAKRGTDHEDHSRYLRPRFRIHHWHGGRDRRCHCRLIAMRGSPTMNAERIERNREARHALALSIVGVFAVMVLLNLTTLFFY